jgi:uncharacterized protein (TIGR03089 family)
VNLTDQLFSSYVRNPASPLITHYDDATGARVELSVATMRNWAAKTANWLTEELDVEPGDPVAVLLPAHWQTVGVLLGAWWCGAQVVGEAAGAAVAFVPPNGAAPGATAVAAVSLDPMGRDLGGSTSTLLDYIGEARVHGDDYLALNQVPGDTPCLAGTTVDEVLATARKNAELLAVDATSRLLSTLDWTVPDGILNGVLVPLAAGASLVQVSNADPAKLAKHNATERATHVIQ